MLSHYFSWLTRIKFKYHAFIRLYYYWSFLDAQLQLLENHTFIRIISSPQKSPSRWWCPTTSYLLLQSQMTTNLPHMRDLSALDISYNESYNAWPLLDWLFCPAGENVSKVHLIVSCISSWTARSVSDSLLIHGRSLPEAPSICGFPNEYWSGLLFQLRGSFIGDVNISTIILYICGWILLQWASMRKLY